MKEQNILGWIVTCSRTTFVVRIDDLIYVFEESSCWHLH